MARDNQRLKLQYGGMTSSPDDYLSPDGDLMACIGLEDIAGAKMSAKRHEPKEVCRCSTETDQTQQYCEKRNYDVIYIHDMSGTKIAVLKCSVKYPNFPQSGYIGCSWIDVTSGWPSVITSTNTTKISALDNKDIKAIKHVGNTLIVNTGDEMHYLLYKAGSTSDQSSAEYKYLGTKLPDPYITFGLKTEYCHYLDGRGIIGDNSEDAEAEEEPSEDDEKLFVEDRWKFAVAISPVGEERIRDIADSSVEYTTERILSKVSKCISEGVEKNWFMQPFLVRYALKLYDGTTAMASAPVYMPVCVKKEGFTMPYCLYDKFTNDDDALWYIGYTKSALDYAISSESKAQLMLWSDIVKGVTIAITSPIYTYNPAGKITKMWCGNYGAQSLSFYENKLTTVQTLSCSAYNTEYGLYSVSGLHNPSKEMYPGGWDPNFSKSKKVGYPLGCYYLPERTESEFNEDLKSRSVFYVLKEINTEDLSTTRKIIKVKKGYLSTIENQITLKDSYHDHDDLSADFMYSYNGRLNLAGIKRKLYNGFKPTVLFPYENGDSTSKTVQLSFEVEEEGRNEIVKSATETIGYIPHGLSYLYYPNENVKYLWVSDKTNATEKTMKVKMESHNGLNGSVYLGDVDTYYNDVKSTTPSPAATTGVVQTPQKLYTSNALNPFVFEPANINTIGNSKILGMAIAAKAISLGQAGYYPMYCMTEDGVWILEVSETGGWKGKQAIMRDVCTVPEAIIETDGAVIMPTSRGLMMIQGEQSVCLTDANSKTAYITASDLPKLVDVIRDKWNIACQDITRDVIVDIDEYLHSESLRGVYDYKNQRVIYYRPDRDYSVVLSMGQSPQISTQKWDLKNSPYSVNGCPVMIEYNGNSYMADLSGKEYTITGTDDIPLSLSDKALIITRPIKGTEVGMRDLRKQLDTVWHQGRYKRGSFDILLYGTEDYKKWHMIGQAKDATGLYGHHGQHWMAFILVMYIKNMTEKDCIDCVDLTMTARLSGKSAAISGYK